MLSAEWQDLIQKKRAARDALIPKEWRLPESILSRVSKTSTESAFDLLKESAMLTPREVEITEGNTATSLVAKIAKGEVSSYDVAAAFCKRAALVHQLTNSLTEIFFDKALERARWLDEYFAKEGKTAGPLHGLPITLKDMINVKGELSTMGFVSHLKYPVADENSIIVDVLDAAGAVFYCKTNLPQTLFVCESYNNVYGQTLNPYKLCLSPGGSSSGEAAQLGLQGSIMGVGSDIAGSVRVPAILTGGFGFRPTVNRIPIAKQAELAQKGWTGISPTLGPMTRSAEDLTLFMKTVIQYRPWMYDSTALAVPWHDAPKKEQLTIGVWLQDPEFPVFPPVARAMATAVDKLKAADHNIKILSSAPSTMRAMKISMRSFALDTEGLAHKFLADAGEDPIADLAAMNPGDYLDDDFVADLRENERVAADLHDYRHDWAKIWWEHDLDVLICPPCRGTALPHGEFGPLMYSILWNLLDFPSSVVPVGKADKILDSKDGYDASIVDGAPTGIQIVGWRFQDEQTLMATEVIADALRA